MQGLAELVEHSIEDGALGGVLGERPWLGHVNVAIQVADENPDDLQGALSLEFVHRIPDPGHHNVLKLVLEVVHGAQGFYG